MIISMTAPPPGRSPGMTVDQEGAVVVHLHEVKSIFREMAMSLTAKGLWALRVYMSVIFSPAFARAISVITQWYRDPSGPTTLVLSILPLLLLHCARSSDRIVVSRPAISARSLSGNGVFVVERHHELLRMWFVHGSR